VEVKERILAGEGERDDHPHHSKESARTSLLGFLDRVTVLRLVVLSDLADKLREGLFDVDATFGGDFVERAAKGLGQFLTFHSSHSSFLLQVALVPHQDHGHLLLVLNTEDLVMKGSNLIKRGATGDGVGAKEPWPRSMYCSRTAKNSSSPEVSRISSRHASSSMISVLW
jgi:hypothetical protein